MFTIFDALLCWTLLSTMICGFVFWQLGRARKGR